MSQSPLTFEDDEVFVSALEYTATTYENDRVRKLTQKCDRHLIPPLFLICFYAFIDRINIGNARIQGLGTDLRVSSQIVKGSKDIWRIDCHEGFVGIFQAVSYLRHCLPPRGILSALSATIKTKRLDLFNRFASAFGGLLAYAIAGTAGTDG
ncbi:hypothetical protein HO173_012959 [Letharia columbiana]|uniref:Uncharacterized protein n=1 Tax=Letharia columbiana TaxID=112416 RepID=A0A8H6FE07_9LECA|nr:uncharacterized protein HO173_012959 [Letharia columbiana]KAF6224616.1 hypothetical protein HO173_012959 [Letharia columbiana]